MPSIAALERHAQGMHADDCAKVQDFTGGAECDCGFEDIQVLALELRDAIEDLNDRLAQVERLMGERHFAPASIDVDGAQFGWDGARLLWNKSPVRSVSRECRVKAAHSLHRLGDAMGIK